MLSFQAALERTDCSVSGFRFPYFPFGGLFVCKCLFLQLSKAPSKQQQKYKVGKEVLGEAAAAASVGYSTNDERKGN